MKYAALLDDHYLWRQLFREAQEAERGERVVRHRLPVVDIASHSNPLDTEIANIMQRYEDRAAWNQAFEDRLRGAVQPGYVKQISKDAATAELRFVNDVDALIKAGELEDALALNRYMWSPYSTLSQEIGETIINRVTEKTFADNETLIRTKLESLQKRVSALQ